MRVRLITLIHLCGAIACSTSLEARLRPGMDTTLARAQRAVAAAKADAMAAPHLADTQSERLAWGLEQRARAAEADMQAIDQLPAAPSSQAAIEAAADHAARLYEAAAHYRLAIAARDPAASTDLQKAWDHCEAVRALAAYHRDAVRQEIHGLEQFSQQRRARAASLLSQTDRVTRAP